MRPRFVSMIAISALVLFGCSEPGDVSTDESNAEQTSETGADSSSRDNSDTEETLDGGATADEVQPEFSYDIPNPFENSNHGYLLEDNRIPRIENCVEWENFWMGLGPAVSFEAAEKSQIDGVEVSTQIFIKNQHLDSNRDGVLCLNEDGGVSADDESSQNSNFATVEDTPAQQLLSSSSCKLPSAATDSRGERISFPLSDDYLPSRDQINIRVIALDFTDIQGTKNGMRTTYNQFDEFLNFMDRSSYGRAKINMSLHPERVQVPVASGYFGMQEWNQGDGYLYYVTALEAADPFVDFTGVDAVVFVPPVGVVDIAYGPVSIARDGEGQMTDEGRVQVGVTGGADMYRFNSEWIWLAHEMGHALGMPHIYHSQDTAAIFDVMYWGDISPDYIAWTKWRLGWIDDSQVRCIETNSRPKLETSHKLSPLSSADYETKAVMTKLSDFETLVIEHRTHQPFDRFTGWKEGLFIYKVDTRSEIGYDGVNSGIQAIEPLIKEQRYRGKWVGTLGAGETATVEGLQIQVLNCGVDDCQFKVSESG